MLNIFGTTRRMHVAFYDFHTLSGRCPTAKFNYRISAAGGCLVMCEQARGKRSGGGGWRPLGVQITHVDPGTWLAFSRVTLALHTPNHSPPPPTPRPASPPTPILWRLDPLLLYLLECFEIFERMMRALLLWLWVGFFHWGLTTRSTVSKVPTRGDRLKDIDWKLYRVLEWFIFIIFLGYKLK